MHKPTTGGFIMSRDTTLAQAVFGDLGLAKQAGLVLAGTVLIAIAAQFSIFIGPVPLSLQTLAILTVSFALGARLAVATLVVYLAQGAAGLPVFSGGGASVAYMMGPTGGFLLGFVAMAWLAGLASDMGLTRRALPAIGAALLASAIIYVPGLLWPALAFGTEWVSLWAHWMAPFLAGDALKSVIAALAVCGGLAWMRPRA
jgi:biotin transport system substrate-specific component